MTSFSRNLSYNYLGTLSISLIGFLTTPLLIRLIGIDEFGAWALLGAFVAYTSLFDFGVGLAGMKMVAEHSLDTDHKKINEIFSNVVFTYIVLSLVLLVVGLALSPFINHLFKVPSYLEHDFVVAFAIFVVSSCISFSGAAFSGIMQGLHDFKSYNKSVILQAFCVVVSALIIGGLTHSLVYMALGNAIVIIFIWLYKAALLYGKGLRLHKATLSQKLIKHIFHFSSAVFVVNVAGRIIFETDSVIIGALAGTTAVASYQVAQNPVTALRRIGDQLNSVTLTSSSRLNAEGKIQELQALFLRATKYSLIIMLPFLACASFLAKDFLRTWVGSQFESSYLVLIFLAFGIAAVNLQATSTQVILSLNKHKTLAIVLSVEAVINLLLSIVLLKHIGITGVALGTTLPTLCTALLYTIPRAAHHLSLTYRNVLNSLKFPLLAALIGIPILAIGRSTLQFSNLLQVMLVSLIYVIIYAVALYLLDEDSRQYANKLFKGVA